MSRREMLEAFVQQHPDDAFARYGLAMEIMGAGDAPAALEQFALLRQRHPDYPAAYHQEGQLLLRLGRADDARSVLEHGVEAAQRRGDAHAGSEMQALLEEIGNGRL